MQAYLEQLHFILDNGIVRGDRTGVGTISVFGLTARYNMADGFPAMTTKKLAWKVMSSELLWFISGSTNINDLKEIYQHNKIWDANYDDYVKRLGMETSTGDMGRVYGSQWRKWKTVDGREVDQLSDAVDLIKNNPNSRRIIVNAWNPGEASPDQVALPPCHTFFQFYVADGKLSLHMYQRSADMFLGVPFNIASYSLLLHMMAKITGLTAHEFVHTIGDAHIYLNAVEQAKEQITRSPLPRPSLKIVDRGQKTIDDFAMTDFSLSDYQSHEPIKARMAV
jgi:thymidylate synthase|tara:strand:- start:17014 stop:17853 length:840 start_codon:yes stop_codon:yes gene_type:complete